MNLRPGQIMVMAAGAIVLIFSLFTFIGFGDAPAECEHIPSYHQVPSSVSRDQYDKFVAACDLADGASAWNLDLTFPVATWPAIIGLVTAGSTAASIFGKVRLPSVLGLGPSQWTATLALSAALIMFMYLVGGNENGDWGIGFWLMLLGSFVLLGGAVLELVQGPSTASSGGGAPGFPGQQGGYPPQGPGGYPPQGPPPGGGYPPQAPPPGPPQVPGGYPPEGPPPGSGHPPQGPPQGGF